MPESLEKRAFRKGVSIPGPAVHAELMYICPGVWKKKWDGGRKERARGENHISEGSNSDPKGSGESGNRVRNMIRQKFCVSLEAREPGWESERV